MTSPAAPRHAAAAALIFALLACCASPSLGFTLPDQLEKIEAFRDAMLARPGQQNWTKALASWACPTDPASSAGSGCDPCGQRVWGNWDHLACRGPRISFTEEQASLRGGSAGFEDGRAHPARRPHHLSSEPHSTQICGAVMSSGPLPRLLPASPRAAPSLFPLPVPPFPRCLPTNRLQVPGTGVINHIHITDYSIEGAVPLEELCPLSGLVEFDVDGGLLAGPIPTGFARCFPELRELDLSYNRLTGGRHEQGRQSECPVLEQDKAIALLNAQTTPGARGSACWLPMLWRACTWHGVAQPACSCAHPACPAGTLPKEIAQVETLEQFKVGSWPARKSTARGGA